MPINDDAPCLQGQLRRVGELFYNTKVDIFVVEESENLEDKTIHVKFRLLFNNVAYKENTRSSVDSVVDNIPLRSAPYVGIARGRVLFFPLVSVDSPLASCPVL